VIGGVQSLASERLFAGSIGKERELLSGRERRDINQGRLGRRG
jgi:hypothetical protein